MKFKTYIWVALATTALSACDATHSDNTSSGITGEIPVDFTGEYTLGGDCTALTGTMSIRTDTIRVSETVCQIISSRHINTSSTEYKLEDCQSEGTKQANRKVVISEVEDGQILLSDWVVDDFIFDMCS